MSWENRKRQRGLCTSDQAYLGVNTIPPVIPVRRYHLIRFCHFAPWQYDIIIPLVGGPDSCSISHDYAAKLFFLIVCWFGRWSYPFGEYDINEVFRCVMWSPSTDPPIFLEDPLVHHSVCLSVTRWLQNRKDNSMVSLQHG